MLKSYALWLLCFMPVGAQAVDVYVAFDAQGSVHFADRPLDASYRLLLRDIQSDQPVVARASVHPWPRVPAEPGSEIRSILEDAAGRYGLEYELLHAVAQAESGFDAHAVSPKGAIGLMQLMPETARRYGVPGWDAASLRANLRRTHLNVAAGSQYLRDLLALFGGRLELALAAYNAGEGAVRRAGNRVPDYPETRSYVQRVMRTLERLRTESADGQSRAAVVSDAGLMPADAAAVATAAGPGARRAGSAAAAVQLFRGAEVEIQRFERGFSP